jgi:hypothetical protein
VLLARVRAVKRRLRSPHAAAQQLFGRQEFGKAVKRNLQASMDDEKYRGGKVKLVVAL